MTTEIEKNQRVILQFLYEVDTKTQLSANGEGIRKATNLGPTQINDAVDLLHHAGLVDWFRTLGTAPYHFYSVKISARGKRKMQEANLPASIPLAASLRKQIKPSGKDPRRVFVVHGRNLEAYDAFCDFLRSIDLRPMEWPQILSDTGKGSPYIGEILEKAFSEAQAVVILMTPDDEGCLREPFRKTEDPIYETELTPQARLNVLFEAGMAMTLFRESAILVELGKLRPFSDIGGRHVLKLDNSVTKRQELAQRLKTAGCTVDISGTDWHTAGKLVVDLNESITPPFKIILQRFQEAIEKPVKSNWSIRILHPEKPIEKCIVFLGNTRLPWWNKDMPYYETTIVAYGRGNVRIPVEIENENEVVTVMDGRRVLRREKFKDIVVGSP